MEERTRPDDGGDGVGWPEEQEDGGGGAGSEVIEAGQAQGEEECERLECMGQMDGCADVTGDDE